MTREEKIIAFGNAKRNEEEKRHTEESIKRQRLIREIKSHQERVNKLINLATLCRDNGVALGEKQDSLHSKGIESNCFISNGWSHRFGFKRDLTALGFYNGGANGKEDMWLYNDTTLQYPTHEFHIYNDGLEKWLKRFDEFESAFLNYIDELM